MAVNTIIGQVATGENFFPRPDITRTFWEKIKSGSNILITAPRRIGKTSLMYHFSDNPIPGYKVIYMITESVNNENEFFKKVYKSLIEELKGTKKIWKSIIVAMKSKKITSIGPKGITMDDNKINYFNELNIMVRNTDFNNLKVLIMIDEFPQTIENIMKDENNRNAVLFVGKNRELRQQPETNQKVQFVYTGSIGLENIINRLNCMGAIADLYSLRVPPLTKKEARDLIIKLIKNAEWTLNNEQAEYIVNKISWLIPYCIQIIVDEIEKIEKNKKNEITIPVIDNAFSEAIRHRNYFEHWLTRLRNAFKGHEFSFAKEILNYTSKNQLIDNSIIVDFAEKYELRDGYKDILNILVHDGYINNNDNPKQYRFNSPLLQMWWFNSVTN